MSDTICLFAIVVFSLTTGYLLSFVRQLHRECEKTTTCLEAILSIAVSVKDKVGAAPEGLPAGLYVTSEPDKNGHVELVPMTSKQRHY